MTNDTERREVARRLRELPDDSTYPDLIGAIADHDGWYAAADAADRLADLIEPTDGFDLDAVQRVCFECMECCDEPEWTLYTTIHDAIARYKRGESGPTCDRDALLALAEELERPMRDGGYSKRIARRIREACGEVES